LDSGSARKSAHPGHDESFVNAMFTTFMRPRFTNVFDGAARITANPCVWRVRIAD
jgi:hypothetical protein